MHAMASSKVVDNSSSACQSEIVRPVANFSPSLWGDLFCSSFYMDTSMVLEAYVKEIEVLKKEVRRMIVATGKNGDTGEKIELIDTVERLGLAYHFEKEIEDLLETMFIALNSYKFENDCVDYDLSTVALHFRLLRQHGYDVSTSIFSKFMEKGKFKESLSGDAKGLLSLYEAAHLRTHGESILDDALAFATKNLEAIATESALRSSTLGKKISHALEQSLQRGVPIIELRHFISSYVEDVSHNEILLRLAKLDFNLLQILHRKELCEVSRWWKDLNLVSELPYARDRIVECYFWTLGVYYQPQYSSARIMLTKTIAMISVIDDTYDAYGTIQELQLFTHAVQRWDRSEINNLPSYMRIIYNVLLDLYEAYEEELKQQGRSYAVHYAKETMKEIVRSYYIEAEWFIEGYLPPFAEYMRNGKITSTYYLLTTTSLMGMNSATREAFNWLLENPKILEASVTICRVVDDVATYEIEKSRGQVTTGIECYMKEYGVSTQDAIDYFCEIAENAWKDMNESLKETSEVSVEIRMRVLNLARLIDVVYKHNNDGYTNPEKVLKPLITGLLVEPFNI